MINSNLIIAIIVTICLLSGTTILSYGVTNQIPSPREQTDKGISPANIVCKAGLTLLVRSNTDTPACVKKTSSDRLVQNGWAVKLSTFMEKRPQISNIGNVNTIQVIPLFADKQRLDTNPTIVTKYNYVFEACAKSIFIRAPEVLITSDSETKSVILSDSIQPNTCQTSATVIKATDTNSIKASVIKKTDISIIVGELESEVVELKDKLAKEKKDLADLVKQNPPPSDFQKKISDKTDSIITLRNELNIARADLQKNQYSLMVGFKAPPSIQSPPQTSEATTSANATTSYPYVSKIKAVPQISNSGRLNSEPLMSSSYNFVFEACAGKYEILFPEVMIRSDTEVKTVKLSDSLNIKECQTTSTMIKAANSDSIQATIISSEDISKLIKDLESKVEVLKEDIAVSKKTLSDLTRQSPPPDDFRQKVTELTDKIVNQRNELNQAKHDLISLKYMAN